jgi:hypothetical protein
MAEHLVRANPALARRLLLRTAARHPAAALREVRQYIDLPYGPEIREAARRAAAANPPADLRLLELRQNPSLATGLPDAERLRLAAAAQSEEEHETAVAILRDHSFSADSAAADLRGALALLADTGAPLRVPDAVLRRAFTGMDEAEDPLAEAVKAASILAAAGPESFAQLPDSPVARLLRLPREAPALPVADLFPGGVCVQRHIFHNDDDGVESFESFLRAYAGDPDWQLETHDAYVRLTGRGGNGRRIEIYANRPDAPQDVVTRALPAAPSVIVHRGHDHHFPATRRLLRADARLVFLGSCRGMQSVEDVVTRCRRAQMIATRAIGATAVNDTFLRALNRRLLAPDAVTLDWDAFWISLQPLLGGNGHFADYVPPHRNEAARFLAAWYRHALAAP